MGKVDAFIDVLRQVADAKRGEREGRLRLEQAFNTLLSEYAEELSFSI